MEFEFKSLQDILTEKLCEHLFAGPPILVVGVGSDDTASSILVETKRGEAFGKDAGSITGRIVELLKAKEKSSEFKGINERLINNTLIQKFSRKKLAEKLTDLTTY